MTTQVSPSAVSPSARAPYAKNVRSIVIASTGNILEWFDFTVYGFLAVVMSKQFFPSTDDSVALLATFATFGVGFVSRPVGAIAFGWIGDVKGRKFVLLLSMFLMAGASVLMGVTPTYAEIGIWAPVLIVIARLVQGFSAGGEWGNAVAFLVEWAPEDRRGFYGSFHQIGASGGLLVGSTLVAALSTALSAADFAAWGWRVPFLLGGTLAFVAMYMRRNVEETPMFEKKAAAQPVPVAETFVLFLKTVGIVTLWTVSVFATIVYMPTFTQKFGNLTPSGALWATTIALTVSMVALPLCGYLSDRFGRKPLMLAACVAFALLTLPFFMIIVAGAAFSTIVLILGLFAFFSALIAGPGPATISELYSTERRSTWVSIGSAIAVVIFGGFAPFIATLLISKTGSPVSPAYYVVATAVITAITVLTLRETAKTSLR